MSTYKVKIYSSDNRFHNKQLVFNTGTSVEKGTKLTWIEPLREDATNSEINWHNTVSKLVVKDDR